MIVVVVCAAVFAAVVGLAADTATSPGGFAVLFFAALVAGLWVRSKLPRTTTGHSHGHANTLVARHEAGHAAAAKYVGGRVVSARVQGGGGVVRARLPADPRNEVAFLTAGRLASGTREGCGADDAEIRAVLRGVPAAQRGQVRRDGERLARRAVSSRSGQIRRDTRRLQERGRL